MPATRLAAKPPMMLLVGSRLRPATGPATEPVRARAAGARVGPAPTIPPAAGRSQRQPPHPPPLPPPLLAIPSPPRSSWHVQLLKPELLLCPQLDLVGESTCCGVGESSRGGPRGQGSGQVERGDTIEDSRASQAARAAAAPCSSSGNVQRWSHVAETPVIPDPRALDSLTVTAHSMLLPQSRAASTLLMVFIGGA
jgi:hypothetical protein